VPAALQHFVPAHNNRQFVFHDVPGGDGVVPPMGLLPRASASRVRVQSCWWRRCPFSEQTKICWVFPSFL